jgi:hypothetical protein
VQHAGALKDAIAAGKAEVEEAKEQLCQELKEEKKLRQLEKDRNKELAVVQDSIAQFIKELDEKVRSKCFAFAYKLSFLAGLFLHRLLLIFLQKSSQTHRYV